MIIIVEEIKYPQALSTLRRFSANYVKNESAKLILECIVIPNTNLFFLFAVNLCSWSDSGHLFVVQGKY